MDDKEGEKIKSFVAIHSGETCKFKEVGFLRGLPRGVRSRYQFQIVVTFICLFFGPI